MQTSSGQDRSLISSEAPDRDGELSNRVLIHGASRETHKPGNGRSPDAHHQAWTRQLGESVVSPSSESTPSRGPFDSHGQHNGMFLLSSLSLT
jgi:hypothetical protein